jgi:hypothetical protein
VSICETESSSYPQDEQKRLPLKQKLGRMSIEAAALSFASGVNYRDSWSGKKAYRETSARRLFAY